LRELLETAAAKSGEKPGHGGTLLVGPSGEVTPRPAADDGGVLSDELGPGEEVEDLALFGHGSQEATLARA